MRKNLYIISSLIFVFIIIAFYYLLLIERDPSEIPSNLINKEIPVFKTEKFGFPRPCRKSVFCLNQLHTKL